MPVPSGVSSRHSQVASRLEALARRLGPGAKLPRVSQLCAEFGVSARTLDAALRELEAAGLIERRHAVGIFCTERVKSRSRAPRLALICQPACFQSAEHSPVWDQLLGLLQERAAHDGLEFDCFFTRHAKYEGGETLPPMVQSALEHGELDGVLGLELPDTVAKSIMALHVPLVALFSYGHVSVGVDSGQQVALGVNELARRGARRLVLWQPITPHSVKASLLLQGLAREPFVAAMRAQGLAVESSPWRSVADTVDVLNAPVEFTLEQGIRLAHETFSAPRSAWPDGLVITDDMMARGALLALRQLGVRVGRDVQLAVHTNRNSPVLLGEDDLIQIEIDPAELVETMWHHLNQLLEEGLPAEPLEVRCAPYLLPPSLSTPRFRARPSMFPGALAPTT